MTVSDASDFGGTRPPRKARGLAAWFALACERILLDGRILFSLVAAILAAGLASQLASLINHDTAWYLYAGDRFLEGGRLYRDIFVDVNPPLGFYLSLPPVVLARLTGLFPVDVFVAYVYLSITLSLAATWWLVRADADAPLVLRRGLILAAAVVLTVAPADQFGQREHFLVALCLPYLVLATLRARRGPVPVSVPWAMAAGVGAAAALGFGLKPHFLLVPLAIEGYRWAITRRATAILRPETLALAAVLALYAAAVAIFTPEYLARIVPYALEVYNAAFRNPLPIVLWRGETAVLPLLCLVHIATRRSQAAPGYGDAFLVAATCFFVAYLTQATGWYYHLYPASAYLVLASAGLFLNGLLVPKRARRAPANRDLTPGLVLASLAAALLLVASDAARGGYRNPFMDTMRPHVERHAAGGSIMIFSTNVSRAFPLVNYAGVGWSSRFPTLWLLPGARQKRESGNQVDGVLLDEVERYTREAVVADLAADPPNLIIVDNRRNKPFFGAVSFDYIAYFREDPRFARIWSQYEWIAREGAGAYQLYRRRCASDC